MWRYYRIRRIGEWNIVTFYAPDLHSAFDLARRRWGSASLECLGSTK